MSPHPSSPESSPPPPSERTPLLPTTTATNPPRSASRASSRSSSSAARKPSPTQPHRRPILLLSALLFLLTSLSLSLLFLALLGRSLQPTPEAQQQALVLSGPDAIRVLAHFPSGDGTGGQTAIVEVGLRLGLDAETLLSLSPSSSSFSPGVWDRARSALGTWAVKRAESVSVSLPDAIWLSAAVGNSTADGGSPVVLVHPLAQHPIVLPLSTSVRSPSSLALASGKPSADDDAWLSPLTLQFSTALLCPPADLLAFARRALGAGKVGVHVRMEGGEVRGVGKWFGRVGKALEEIKTVVDFDREFRRPSSVCALLLLGWTGAEGGEGATSVSALSSLPGRFPALPTQAPSTDALAPSSSSPQSARSGSRWTCPSQRSPPSPSCSSRANLARRPRARPSATRPVPELPPFANLSSSLTLHSYTLSHAPASNTSLAPSSSPSPEPQANLLVLANCSIPNPSLSFPHSQSLDLKGLGWPSGVRWSAQVEVPGQPLGPPVGRMEVLPFEVDTKAENVSFVIRGELLPQAHLGGGGGSGENQTTPALEAFLSAYLGPSPLPLFLTPSRLPSSTPAEESQLPLVPSLLLAYGPLSLPVPPADPPLRPLRSLEIEGMKLSEGRDGRMRASGRVRAVVDVPGLKGSQGVDVEVGWVRPDSASLLPSLAPSCSPRLRGTDGSPPPPPGPPSLHLQRTGPRLPSVQHLLLPPAAR